MVEVAIGMRPRGSELRPWGSWGPGLLGHGLHESPGRTIEPFLVWGRRLVGHGKCGESCDRLAVLLLQMLSRARVCACTRVCPRRLWVECFVGFDKSSEYLSSLGGAADLELLSINQINQSG